MSEPIRKYEWKRLGDVTRGNIKPIVPPGRTSEEIKQDYKDYFSGRKLSDDDLVWTQKGALVRGNNKQAQRDYALQYGNPRFETELNPITVIHNKDTNTTHTRLGDTFEDRYENLLKAPTANQLGLKYNQQTPYQENNDIQTTAHLNKLAADRLVRNRSMSQFNKTEMNNLANLSLTFAGGAALAPAILTGPIATAGMIGGGLFGDWLGNGLTEKISHGKYKTWGSFIDDVTNGYIREDNAQMTNPATLLYGATFGAATPLATKAISYKLPNNNFSRILNDFSTLPGNWGTIKAIQDGRYVLTKGGEKRQLQRMFNELNNIKTQVKELNADGKSIRQKYNKDRGKNNYDNTDITFLNRKEQAFYEKKGWDADYDLTNNKVQMPAYRNSRSNVAKDYSNNNRNMGLAGHEFQHSYQENEGYGIDVPKEKYYAPNPDHITYSASRVLEKKRPDSEFTKYKDPEFMKKWVKSADEVDSEVMKYRITHNSQPRFNQMDRFHQEELSSIISKRFHISPEEAFRLLLMRGIRGY